MKHSTNHRRMAVAILTIAVLLCTCTSAIAENIVFKMGSQCGESSDWVKWVNLFSDRMNEKSGGTMSIELVTGGALGTIAEHFSQMNNGTLDMMVQGGDAPSVAPGGADFDILNLPFLFNSYEHFQKFLESDVLAEMVAQLQTKTNVIWLGELNDSPVRALSTSKKAVKTPADLRGLQIRVPGSRLLTQVWSDLGATPVTAAMGELMEALQTGRIDGQENGLSIVVQGYYEQQKYYMELNHTYGGIVIYVSGKTWEKLSDEQKGWMKDALDEVRTELHSELQDVTIPHYQELLVATGITVIPNSEIDVEAFRKVISDHISSYEGRFFSKGLYERIQALDE